MMIVFDKVILYIGVMRTLRIAMAQINTTVGDLEGNVTRCLAAVEEAKSRKCDLIVFPELALTGYPPEDLLLKPGFLKESRRALDSFTREVGGICAVVGYVDGEGPVYNAAGVVSDRILHCTYRKMLLPNYGVFDEKRYFTPGSDLVSFTVGDVVIGINICEDTWADDGPHCGLVVDHYADVMINLSASPFHAGKIYERSEMLTHRTRSCGVAIVYVNLVGGQDELVFDGGSLVFDKEGTCIARAPMFTEGVATVDLTFDYDPPDDMNSSIVVERAGSDKPPMQPVMTPEISIEQEILDALVIGTRDYLNKNGFEKAVIGLSGGIDSSIVAAIAVRALGSDNVVGVTMPSVYTSSETRGDAEVLAENLGIRFMEIPIGSVFDSLTGIMADAFKGTEPDITEENMQARIRGMILMALSNKYRWLVLTTGNKSEMATGYSTLYGDMAGGFAVIKDVPKTMVYRICRFINDQEGREVIPESVLIRPPTAELRPDQKDSDSLPEYDLLDGILKAYIEEDRGVEEIVSLGFDRDLVKRVVRLVDIAEYKRRQAPPGIKITPRAFGRDRRLPITNRFRP